MSGVDTSLSLINQTVNITTALGVQSISLELFNEFRDRSVQSAVVAGVRFGAAVVAMIVSFLFTQERKQPAFILNQISLILVLCQTAFQMVYLMTSLAGPVNIVTQSYPGLDRALRISATANVFQMLIIPSVLASLVFQTVCLYKQHAKLRFIVPGAIGLLSLVTTGFWLTYLVSLNISYYTPANSVLYSHPWIVYASRVLFCSTVTVFSVLSLCKLFLTIRRRRRLGLKQFGPFQILFITSFQTMLIPTAFTFGEIARGDGAIYLSSISVLVVVVFLPLSSLWARFSTMSSIDNSHVLAISHSNRSSSFSSDTGSRSILTKQEIFTSTTTYPQSPGTLLTARGMDNYYLSK
ncbi:hypothetical protein TRVA0_015S01860 [Trichomonascus vanleenenianus]|uniref:alpha-factor pheromone receptor STE2 n=1 Tax=Trichomonascus vanleenenianus TaxID=2268995 RepID=UPI003EC9CCE1